MCQAIRTLSDAADGGRRTCPFCKRSGIFSPRVSCMKLHVCGRRSKKAAYLMHW